MANESNPENQKVVLKSTDFKKSAKAKEVPFMLGQANKILSLKNAKWELADKNFKWNGKELAKVAKA